MIIDAHTHIGFGKYITADPKDLVAGMKKAGINRSIVFAGEINLCPTEKLLQALIPYKKALVPVGSVSPISQSRPAPEKVEQWLKKNMIYGLKFYPGYEYFYPNGKEIEPYLALLEEYKRPAIFHTGDTYDVAKIALVKYALPLNIDEIAVRHPNLPIILAHIGNPWIIDATEMLYKNSNVFADCSGLVYEFFKPYEKKLFRKKFEEMREYLGSLEKILFGTDWPITQQKPYLDFIKTLLQTGKERKRIFSENALDIFRLA